MSKTFAGNPALVDLHLEVAAGSVHALLGENGSGKSTLIKTLSGYHMPDPGGEAFIAGHRLDFGSPEASHDLGARFVHQDLGLVDSCSIADNMALTTGFPSRFGTIKAAQLRQQARAGLERLGLDLDPDQLVGELPAAMRTGVALARALGDADRSEVTVLVLDEPTATLPASEVQHLLEMIRAVAAGGVGVVYVSHHIDEVFEVAHAVSVLRDGRKVATTRTSDVTRSELINHLLGHELEEVQAASDALPDPRVDAVLRVADLHSGPLTGFSLETYAGEIVGIAGITGSGRETVLPALFGAIPRSGTVSVAGEEVRPHRPDCAIATGTALLPADRARHGGVMSISARENLTLPRLRGFWRFPTLRRGLEQEEAHDWFVRLDVRPRGGIDRPLSTFSGGNQQKILFGKWLRCTPRVLLLDEPTQGVDIGAKAEIHRQVLAAVERGATAVVSSADYDELAALCHRVLVLRVGRVVAELTEDNLTVAAIAHHALGSKGT